MYHGIIGSGMIKIQPNLMEIPVPYRLSMESDARKVVHGDSDLARAPSISLLYNEGPRHWVLLWIDVINSHNLKSFEYEV